MALKKTKKAKNQDRVFESLASMDSRSTSYKGSATLNSAFLAQFANVDEGILPYQNDKSGFSVSDAIKLTQKAYFNVSIFRSTIDIQTEFSNSPIKFVGGSKKSRDFYTAWYKKIKGSKLGEQFFTNLHAYANPKPTRKENLSRPSLKKRGINLRLLEMF